MGNQNQKTESSSDRSTKKALLHKIMKKALLYLVIIVFCGIVISPLVIVFSSSLRTPGNQMSPLKLFVEFSGASYAQAFKNMQYPWQLLNSVMTTVGSVLCIVVFATMAAYPIGRIKSKTAKFLYYFFISGLIIPSQMVIVPIAQTLNRMGIPNTRFTPMIMFITCSLPFSVFLFSGFMKGIPVEIEESAYLEGASLPRRFATVVFPLLQPAIVSCVITQGLWIWNDYFYPMVFISKKAQYSLPVGMLQFLGDKENPAQWNVLFAACVLSVMLLDCHADVSQEQAGRELAAVMQLDERRECVLVQNELMISDTNAGTYAMTSLSRFLSDVGSETLDVCGMLEADFLKYDGSGTFLDLRGCLNERELKELEDCLFTAEDGRVTGLYADGLPGMQKDGCYDAPESRGVVGIIYNTRHLKAARAYLIYLAGK